MELLGENGGGERKGGTGGRVRNRSAQGRGTLFFGIESDATWVERPRI